MSGASPYRARCRNGAGLGVAPEQQAVAAQAGLVGTGAQEVLAAFLQGLGSHLDELAGPAQAHAGDALVSLLLAAFAETEPGRMDTACDR